MFIVDTDVIDAHVENLMESLHSPQVSHNHLNRSTDLYNGPHNSDTMLRYR